MATHYPSILGPNVKPDNSGNVWQEPYSIKATNDFWDFLTWVFANSGAAKIVIHGTFIVPDNYVGTAKIIIFWTSQTITNNVVWDFAYRDITGNNTASLDQATAQETVGSGAVAAPGATDRLMQTTLTLTAGNFVAGDIVEFRLSRDKSSGSDTLAGTVQLVDAAFSYTD